mgnify:FL=1
MSEERAQKIMVLPTERILMMRQAGDGKWFFRHTERFDAVKGKLWEDLVARTKDGMDSLVETMRTEGEEVRAFEENGMIGYEGVFDKGVVADMIVGEMLMESSLGKRTIADLFGLLTALSSGLASPGDLITTKSPEQVEEHLAKGGRIGGLGGD